MIQTKIFPDDNEVGAYLNNMLPELVQILNALRIPRGIICRWNGGGVPEGWLICDGTNGTPTIEGDETYIMKR